MPRNNPTSSRRVRRASNPEPIGENQFHGPGGVQTPKELLVDGAFVDVNALRGTLVYELLEEQGWLHFISKEFECVEPLVLWFYKWFKYDNSSSSHYEIKVNFEDDSSLSFDENNFFEDFGIRDPSFYPDGSERNPVCELRTWPNALVDLGYRRFEDITQHLNNGEFWPNMNTTSYPNVVYFTGDDKLLLKIVREVIFPTKNTDNRVTRFHAIVLMLLKNRVPMHLPHLMMLHMADAITNGQSQYLPYGGVVTWIMRKWGVISENGANPTAPLMIGKTTLNRQQSIRVGSRVFQDWETESMTEQERLIYDPLRQARDMKKARNSRARGQRAPEEPPHDEQPVDEDNRVDEIPICRDEGGSSAPPPMSSMRAELDSIRERHGRKLSGMIQFLRTLGHKSNTPTDALDDLPSSPEE